MPQSTLAITTLTALLSTLLYSSHSRPGFVNALVLFGGWLRNDAHSGCITEALLGADVTHKRHWEAFHRYFSRGTLKLDRLGKALFERLSRLSDGRITLVLDDTFCEKVGRHIFGLGMHLDAVRSSQKHKILGKGHCWVVLCVALKVPWSEHPWAIPVMFRLYVPPKNPDGTRRPKSECRSKSVLARQMLDMLLIWLPEGRQLILAVDSGYANTKLMKGLRGSVLLVAAAKSCSVFQHPLTAKPGPRKSGRPRTCGKRMGTAGELAKSMPFESLTMTRSAKQVTQEVCSFVAQWHGVFGQFPVRVVLLKEPSGKLRVYVCTYADWSVEEILTSYSVRWSVEVWFRSAKQFFGFADSPARSQNAVLSTAPWVGLMSGVMVVWFHDLYGRVPELKRYQPWLPARSTLCFQDVRRIVRAELRTLDMLDWAEATATQSYGPSPCLAV
jgi:hypothetical protein